MTVALKVDLTNEEKNTFSKARKLADKLGEVMRSMADNITGLENDVIAEIYSRADICDNVWQALNDLCNEFDIN